MQGFTTLLAAVASLGFTDARNVFPRDAPIESLASEPVAAAVIASKRAFPNSPSGNYAPAVVDCPTNRPTIRSAAALSPNETAWLELRRNNTVEPMIEWLTRMNISGFDASAYINKVRNNATQLPNIAIAASGGGYRALMNGGGVVAAADNRVEGSTGPGQIGGLLQATTYLAGLSGGGWLVGSIYNNNFSSVQTLRDGFPGSSVWKFGNSIFEGPEQNFQILSTVDYFSSITRDVEKKMDAGYNASITDYWGRAISYQLINAPDGGPAYTWSSFALADNFRAGEIPLPILVADGRAPDETIVSLNSTVYEFNPWEMGSWDPTTFAFAPLEYVGSNFSSGVVPRGGSCVRGFDQSGFVMGTSSSLFNSFILYINATAIPPTLNQIFTNILTTLGSDNNDIAQWQPNPFFHYNNATNRNAQAKQLALVDGGMDLQNIPLNPLIQPERHVDVIFAIDSSADTNFNWPDGASMVATYTRSVNTTIQNGTAFPAIPDHNTFINKGYNNRPTFFGCDQSNITTGPAPLIVYLPNAPYSYNSNVSTFDPSYTDEERNLIIRNGYDGATQGNGTLDANWPKCVACAVLSRSFYKTNTTVPADCQACFTKYCWDGSLDGATPVGNYTPPLKIVNGKIASGADRFGFTGAWLTIATLAAAFFLA